MEWDWLLDTRERARYGDYRSWLFDSLQVSFLWVRGAPTAVGGGDGVVVWGIQFEWAWGMEMRYEEFIKLFLCLAFSPPFLFFFSSFFGGPSYVHVYSHPRDTRRECHGNCKADTLIDLFCDGIAVKQDEGRRRVYHIVNLAHSLM